MKRIVLMIALMLIAGAISSQTLRKGNLVGFHVGKVELAEGVTMKQYQDFCLNKLLPAYNKEMGGDIVVYVGGGDRGVYENFQSRIMVIKSVKVRNKYFPEAGQQSELMKKKMAKIQPLIDELEKLGTFKEDHYTDWVVN